jgi:hypothetical protein
LRNINDRSKYYADDDSDVSSTVSNDAPLPATTNSTEVTILTQDVVADIENANYVSQTHSQSSITNKRNNQRRRRMTLMAIILAIAVALGVGLGIGFFVSNNNDDYNSSSTADGSSSSGDREIDVGDGTNTSTYTTTSPPTPFTTSSYTETIPKPLPGDMASAIQYHVIMQDISSLISLNDMANEGQGGGQRQPTAQQLARDFIVLYDVLPLSVMDEDSVTGEDTVRTSTTLSETIPSLASSSTAAAVGASSVGGSSSSASASTASKASSIVSTNNALPTRPYLQRSTPAYRVAQRYAAAVLYYATNGTNWETNSFWVTPGVHECDFIGVTCEELPIPAITLDEAMQNPDTMPTHDAGGVNTTMERMIVAIDLPENSMGGYLPQEMVAMPYLQRLGLWSNQISGSVPSQIGKLSRLASLLLDDNRFTGSIPSEIGMLREMTDLALGMNMGITGRIPSELGNLNKLEQLHLAKMTLSGYIPAAFGNMANLQELNLGYNMLESSLPDSLTKLGNLESLILDNNHFTGSVTSSWRSMTKLKRLEIQMNDMVFNADTDLCYLRTSSSESVGSLEVLVADCQGNPPEVTCSCCTSCLR